MSLVSASTHTSPTPRHTLTHHCGWMLAVVWWCHAVLCRFATLWQLVSQRNMVPGKKEPSGPPHPLCDLSILSPVSLVVAHLPWSVCYTICRVLAFKDEILNNRLNSEFTRVIKSAHEWAKIISYCLICTCLILKAEALTVLWHQLLKQGLVLPLHPQVVQMCYLFSNSTS